MNWSLCNSCVCLYFSVYFLIVIFLRKQWQVFLLFPCSSYLLYIINMLADKRGVIWNKWRRRRKGRKQVCPSAQMTLSSIWVIQWRLLNQGLGYRKMVFSLPFSIQILTGKREAGNCKPEQSCKSLPGSSLETVYIFCSYTCISCK